MKKKKEKRKQIEKGANPCLVALFSNFEVPHRGQMF
jgi:hypothetical protein